jgi:hypothetical protein
MAFKKNSAAFTGVRGAGKFFPQRFRLKNPAPIGWIYNSPIFHLNTNLIDIP